MSNWRIDYNTERPDFSTLSRRQKTLAVNIPYRGSKGPLHLLIDSTGIKVEGEGEWHARKHGGSKRRVWRKIHLGIDEETLEIRAVKITGSHIGDAPLLTVLAAHANAATPLPAVAHMLLSRPARTRSCGRPSPLAPWPETKPCAPRNTLAVRSGDDGADTAGAASRRRCIV